MRIPHNRKWPIYAMSVGDRFWVEKPSRYLPKTLHKQAARHGIVISVRRVDRRDPQSDIVVMRRA